MSRAFYPPLLVLLLMVLAGCGRSEPERVPTDRATPTSAPIEQGSPESPPTEGTRAPESGVTPGTEATPAAIPPTAPGAVIEVQLTEFQIVMPPTLPAGPLTFEISNVGSMEHNFVLLGGSTTRTFETPLQPGETKLLSVTLDAGNYQSYCPLGDHADRGMRLGVTIAP